MSEIARAADLADRAVDQTGTREGSSATAGVDQIDRVVAGSIDVVAG